jgi:hypothetical protein
MNEFRRARDEIRDEVKELIKDIADAEQQEEPPIAKKPS